MPHTEHFVKHLSWEDYLVLSTMLFVSAAIGVFFGCFGNKMNNTKDYLLAGKSVGILPVSASLGVSFMSAITLLGGPSEVYQNGTVYWLTIFSSYLAIPLVAYIFLPVFWELQLTSVYEYLELRFNKKIRTLGSLAFAVQMTIYMAIATYAPSLALAQMTPLTVYTSVSVMIVVCMFYTSIGGIKAVMWTDVVQTVIMYACLLFIYIKGTSESGGIKHIWQKSVEGGRAVLVDWDPRPTTRHTFWTLVIGSTFPSLNGWGVNQTMVQRYLCLKKKSSAVIAMIIGVTISSAVVVICCYGGLVIYAKYGDCDPVQDGKISKYDQLFPLFAMDILGDFPGLPGLLIAGIFSAALSTISSGINSLTAVTLEDCVRKIYPHLQDEKAVVLSKIISVAFGLITFGLIVLVERLGNILEASLSVYGMLSGPLLGLFILGVVFPWTNSLGAGIGTFSGLIMALWIGFGYRTAVATGQISLKHKEFSTLSCNLTNYEFNHLNIANDTLAYDTIQKTTEGQEDILSIYYLSYQWYSGFGCFITVIVGLMVSFLTGPKKYEDIDERLLTPAARKLFSKQLSYDLKGKEMEIVNCKS